MNPLLSFSACCHFQLCKKNVVTDDNYYNCGVQISECSTVVLRKYHINRQKRSFLVINRFIHSDKNTFPVALRLFYDNRSIGCLSRLLAYPLAGFLPQRQLSTTSIYLLSCPRGTTLVTQRFKQWALDEEIPGLVPRGTVNFNELFSTMALFRRLSSGSWGNVVALALIVKGIYNTLQMYCLQCIVNCCVVKEINLLLLLLFPSLNSGTTT